MNDTIERLALQAGFHAMELLPPSFGDPLGGDVSRVERFAVLVAEECAQVAEADTPNCAERIRAAFITTERKP